MSKPILIFVGQKRRTGKDTFVKLLTEAIEKKGYTVETIANADSLKFLGSQLSGFDREKLDNYKNNVSNKHMIKEKIIDLFSKILNVHRIKIDRKFLVNIGIGLSDHFGQHVIRDVVQNRFELSEANFFIVTDFRLKKETFGSPITIKINRHNSSPTDIDFMKMEMDLNDFNFDIEIDNEGSLLELKEKALNLAIELIKLRNEK